MKICVYTAITGNYDHLLDPTVVSDNIDFICFTDNPNAHSDIWKIRPIPTDLLKLSKVKQQRVIKICPHRYLREYDVSAWIDGNIQVIGDINKFIAEYDLSKFSLYTRKHPQRTCLYDEANACIRTQKDIWQNMQSQLSRYEQEGFPKNYGLAETNIVLRTHNELRCQVLDNFWAAEVLNGSHRDQLSFTYACWKTEFEYGFLQNEPYISNGHSKYFEWRVRHG